MTVTDGARLVELSKYLSWVLRHRPDAVDVELDDGGWTDVEALIAACATDGRAVSRDDLDALIHHGEKRRFELSSDGARIRAIQGHSVDIDLGHEPASPPAVLFHGTVERFLDGIRREGLVRGRRHHVHLSETRAAAEAVGARRGCAVVIEIDASRMAGDGHSFYRAPNGVWLTDHVPPGYLSSPRGG